MTDTFSPVLKLADLPPGSKKVVKLDGKPVLLCNYKDRIFAVSNICSHQYKLLHGGRVRHGKITCPVHGARFDLATGEALDLPATEPIETYDVRVEGDDIEVSL
ncbi:non-heme iron oxygenase ferredoxin subunit [uncultured Abyssibacter sp.]|uniref:Rieske (2Fe-2S) protein n=1 Tax=uncultured Abyssibacter sp. TaxID=2320202 RepID=UPI0032B16D6A